MTNPKPSSRQPKRQAKPSVEIAVISDIHSNLQALDAVAAECKRRTINRYFCLGDIVGYGANPRECLKLIRSLRCPTVRGNHDHYVAFGEVDEDVSFLARRGLEYSAMSLTRQGKQWLRELPEVLLVDDATIVHASLFHPGEWHYIMSPSDALASMDEQTTPLCFHGHTHVTRIFALPGSPAPERMSDRKFRFSKRGHYLINPGSVGQPREADPRAHFAIYNPSEFTVEFVRLDYDKAAAGKAIIEAGLPEFLAERLMEGR